MTAVSNAASKDRSPDFFIEIAGLPVLYGTTKLPPRAYQTVSPDTLDYVGVVAIVPRKGLRQSRRLEADKGVATASPLDVYLSCDDQFGDSTNDPGVVFGRFNTSAATATAFLTETIARDASMPMTVDVSTSLAGLSFPRVVHVGQEAFWATAAAASPATLTLSARALLGTLPQRHDASAASGTFASITTEIVFWRGRRAILWERTRYADDIGTPPNADWIQRWRGDINDEPEFQPDGTVRLSIAPLTARLRQKLGGLRGPTKLATGWHVWSGGVGTLVDYIAFALPRDLYDDTASGASAAGVVKAKVTARWQAAFATAGALVTGHPRSGLLEFRDDGGGTTASPTVPIAVTNATDFEVPTDDPDVALAAGDHVFNAACAEVKQVTIADTSAGVVVGRWPDTLLGAVNDSATGWLVDDKDSYEGGWFNVALSTEGEAGPELRFTLASDCRPQGVVRALLTDRHGPVDVPDQEGGNLNFGAQRPHVWIDDGASTVLRPRADYRGRLDPCAFSVSDPSEGATEGLPTNTLGRQAAYGRQGVVAMRASEQAGLAYRDREIALAYGISTELVVPIPALAAGWHQFGERYMLVESQVGVPSGGTLTMRATQGGEEIAQFEVIAETEVQVDSTTVGWRLELAPAHYEYGSRAPVRSMAVYAGGPEIILEPSVFISDVSAADALGMMLTSDGGHGITSAAWDTLPFGAALDTRTTVAGREMGADLDVTSVVRVPNAGQGVSYQVAWEPGDTVGDVIDGILRSSGYVLDISTDDAGACALRAVRLGLASSAETRGSITDADIVQSPRPSTVVDNAIFNVFEFEYNVDAEGKGIKSTVKVESSVQQFREAKTLKISLPGVVLDTPGVEFVDRFRALYSRLALALAFPRRIFRVQVRAGLAVQMALGATYQITHSLLRGTSGVGVAGAYCRLRSVGGSLWDAAVPCEFEFFPTVGAGWNASGRVASTTSSTVTIDANRYTPTTHPVTGDSYRDIDGFDELGAGSKVTAWPRGNMAGKSTLTVSIVTRSTNTIAFTAPHGLSVGDYIVAHPYATAAAYHQGYAYLGRLTVV